MKTNTIAGGANKANIFFMCALLALMGNAAAIAAAPQKEPLTVQLTLKKVVTDAKGHEKLLDAPQVKPGDVVEYTAVYRNRSKQAVSGLAGSLPVPTGLEYIKQSAHPAAVLATLDGAKFAAEPLMRKVKDANGNEQQEEVPYPEYRGLRWDLGNLDAGQKVAVSARMRVITLAKSPEELVAKPKSSTPVQAK